MVQYLMANRRQNYDSFERGSFEEQYNSRGRKACRACYDFTSWVKKNSSSKEIEEDNRNVECPMSISELGRSTWSLLHTMAAYYPDKPSERQKLEMSEFIKLFSKFYPCEYCAKDFRKNLKRSPPDVESATSLSTWFCVQHNIVNKKLGKPLFDCSKVLERWRDGWRDGSCD